MNTTADRSLLAFAHHPDSVWRSMAADALYDEGRIEESAALLTGFPLVLEVLDDTVKVGLIKRPPYSFCGRRIPASDGEGEETLVQVKCGTGKWFILEIGHSLQVRKHSLTGFEWGYGGSGPAQLALAMLLLIAGRSVAEKHYQRFKRDFVAALSRDQWDVNESAMWFCLKATAKNLHYIDGHFAMKQPEE